MQLSGEIIRRSGTSGVGSENGSGSLLFLSVGIMAVSLARPEGFGVLANSQKKQPGQRGSQGSPNLAPSPQFPDLQNLWAQLGPSWAIVELFWDHLGQSCGRLNHLGPIMSNLGAILGPMPRVF
jgi:hypothetical protein